MHKARAFFFVCAGLLCLALLLPSPAAAYQQTDLQGTWEVSTLASGPGAPWWERAHATIASDGSFTAFTTERYRRSLSCNAKADFLLASSASLRKVISFALERITVFSPRANR